MGSGASGGAAAEQALESEGLRVPRVHPEFHRHLLIACLVVIVSWVLPGHWIQLSNIGFLYLTALLGLRLGEPRRRSGAQVRSSLISSDSRYRLLAIATFIAQLIWWFSPLTLRLSGVPVLALFSLFIAWSMLRLLRVLAYERRIDIRTLCGATAGYLLLGISGGLVLTMLDTILPGGFRDTFTHEVLTMPMPRGIRGEAITWTMDYGRLNYFAFVSLTTVGYGDITPVYPATRLASLLLSLLGPLYIAIVLGILISRFSVPQQTPGLAPDSPPPAPSPAPAEPDPGPGGSGP